MVLKALAEYLGGVGYYHKSRRVLLLHNLAHLWEEGLAHGAEQHLLICSGVGSPSLQVGYAYIQLDPYTEDEVRFTNPIAKASTYYLETVLLLSQKALSLDSGKYYVHKLSDGMVQKRFVQYIINNGSDAWLLEGVSEGETLIID